MPFEIRRLEIPDMILIIPKVYEDERGFFLEVYKKDEFRQVGITSEFIQINHSKSKRGVIRGLHFQKKPYEQAKLIRCIKGMIYDVAVDIRPHSTTFGKYVSVVLSEQNKYILYIPRGFAHGFASLADETEVEYLVDNRYMPEYERGIIWNDKDLNIPWPFSNPILSEKDKKWPTLKELVESGELI